MSQLLAIAAGGAVGAVARYSTSSAVAAWLGRGFPYGTLMVNVVGSLLMGLLFVWLIERASLSTEWRSLLIVGFLGSFTTFSTFSLETLHLLEQANYLKAGGNVLLSVLLCLLACWIGILIARAL